MKSFLKLFFPSAVLCGSIAVAVITLLGPRHLTGEASTASAAPSRGATTKIHQASAKYIGVAAPSAEITSFIKTTGIRPDISEQYVVFGGGFTRPALSGMMPLINIESNSPATDVLAGKFDTWLRWFGHAIAVYGKPTAISVDPEMNGGWYSYGTNNMSHAEYVNVYRHVHNVMYEAGAHNITWVWTISNSAPITHEALLRQLYPGNNYVDWIGVDGYFLNGSTGFSQVFARVFRYVSEFSDRPSIITETSVQPGPNAAAQVRKLLAGVRSSANVLGFIWFDYDKTSVGRQDWRIQDDPSALAAFRKAAW
jgi:mannan endo-1,4-beta-mannosidase